MVTYKDIKKANETITTTDIKGKEYAEVNQRIKAFRMVYPEGFIISAIESLLDGVCVMNAEVGFFDDNGEIRVIGRGHAYERENSSFINKTSYIENCETSAVGRALGMAGFGIDTSVCSAEELKNAKLNQGKNEIDSMMAEADSTPISKAHIEILRDKASKLGVDVASKYGKTSIEELTEGEYGRAMNALASMKGE